MLYGTLTSKSMKPYKVEMNRAALKDVDTLSDWLLEHLSPTGARRYLDAMISEIRIFDFVEK